jgi:hypothetical protein
LSINPRREVIKMSEGNSNGTEDGSAGVLEGILKDVRIEDVLGVINGVFTKERVAATLHHTCQVVADGRFYFPLKLMSGPAYIAEKLGGFGSSEYIEACLVPSREIPGTPEEVAAIRANAVAEVRKSCFEKVDSEELSKQFLAVQAEIRRLHRQDAVSGDYTCPTDGFPTPVDATGTAAKKNK